MGGVILIVLLRRKGNEGRHDVSGSESFGRVLPAYEGRCAHETCPFRLNLTQMLDMEQLYPSTVGANQGTAGPATWLLSNVLFARIVRIKPHEILVRGIERRVLAETHRGGL